MEKKLFVTGIPTSDKNGQASLLRARLLKAVGDFLREADVEEINIAVSTNSEIRITSFSNSEVESDEARGTNGQLNSSDARAVKGKDIYFVQQPLYEFEQLILPSSVEKNLLVTVEAISVEEVVFDLWGMKRIQPYPRSVLNFYGPPGTGKTLAAHAVAKRMNKLILLASYADIESKFHGEGPKNLQTIFRTAEENNAILFIDEADSLLSKRLVEVNSGSEQAINSMRSQLLICLEQFKGVVIFATNLVENYDKAFESRIKNIRFLMPGISERERIWQIHLLDSLPLERIDFTRLSEVDNVCGRDIREAVLDAAIRAALEVKKNGHHPSQGMISTNDLLDSINRIKNERVHAEIGALGNSDIKRKIEQQISSIGS
jgi:SpoVK/Ycf46/Vps4 family AAA+-type ATPase